MNIRVRLTNFQRERESVVIVKCPTREQARGKYVVGHYSIDPRIMAVVLDLSVAFHPSIAKKYRLVPIGGGHFVIDPEEATIRLSGTSDTYGTEPDRHVTATALEAALPGYRIVIE